MENGINLQQSQRLELTLSPQQRLSLEVLQAPLMELQAKLALAVEQNPMLELDPGSIELSVGDPLANAEMGEAAAAAEDLDPEERDRTDLASSERWLNNLPIPESAGDAGMVDDHPLPEADASELAERTRRREFALNSVSTEGTLSQHLLDQLRFMEVPEMLQRAAFEVIGNLDERGFLAASDAEIASGAGCSEEEAARAVALVRSLDPPGIAARTLPESLLLQLAAKNIEDPVIEQLVEGHLDDVARNRLPQLANHFRISLDELKTKLEILKSLDLRPGARFGGTAEPAVIPEFTVRRHGNELVILDNPGALPKLRLSSDYADILANLAPRDEARRFLQEKKTEAEQLIRSLSLRETTLKRVTEVIASCQYEFFMNGPGHLRPLKMAEAADKLGLHETTVSRAVAGKYLGTPYGVYEYKFFFSGGYVSADGEKFASGGIKERIRDIIAGEDGRKPLSDDKIARMFKTEGLDVARRTVAKYRESMNIPPSNLRRKF
ncbi:MAG: RNA polymerase factor sigma-54 [Victivallaceae bacterium]|nr:RNA polymerase factor sigma-54 [Victivallaceae bacterium]